MARSDTIQRLLDQVEELSVHPRNQENLHKWVPHPGHGRDNKWRGVPAPVQAAGEQVPIVVNLELTLKADIFGFSVREYFHNPEVYLENYLKHMIYRFTDIQDDVPVLNAISLFRSAYFEATLFGHGLIYADDDEADLPQTPLINSLSELYSLPKPDFNQGEAMSYAKQLYEYVRDQVQGREFTVTFVEWVRNPFGVATWLYGEQRLVKAMASDPDGVHQFVKHVTDCRLEWTRQRADYLGGEEYETAALYSDSVRRDTMSPQQYREFVQPYEMAIAKLHGGINYWHSCGDTTALLEEIGALPLELFQVGPWTDVRKAAEVLGSRGVALEICLQKYKHYGPGPWPAIDDVFRASPEEYERKIRETVRQAVEGGASAFSIGAGPLHRTQGAEQDVETIKRWVQTARSVLSNADDLFR